ncbi:hypothetical protein [Caviibacter abscessus]|uniref:hypothetical protein n=1 Tax=Caviibacter abscessus TaxID=1766719 RepID=UPI000839A7C1|nr:hypothetical protein [Caviibacter abscessus]
MYAKLGYHQKIDNINIGFDTEFNYESVGLNYYINHRIEKTGETVKNQNVFKVRSNLQNFKYSIKPYANYEINNWNISSSIYLKYRLSTQDISIDEVTDHFVLNKAYLIKFLIMNYGLKLGIAKDDYIKGITHELLVNPKFKVSYTYNMEQFKLIPSVTLSMNYYKFDKDYIIKIFSNELTEKEAKEGFIKPIKAQNINLKENIIYLDYSIKPELTCSYEINKNVEIFANGGADFTMKPVKLNGKNTHELNAKGIGSLGLNFKW